MDGERDWTAPISCFRRRHVPHKYSLKCNHSRVSHIHIQRRDWIHWNPRRVLMSPSGVYSIMQFFRKGHCLLPFFGPYDLASPTFSRTTPLDTMMLTLLFRRQGEDRSARKEFYGLRLRLSVPMVSLVYVLLLNACDDDDIWRFFFLFFWPWRHSWLQSPCLTATVSKDLSYIDSTIVKPIQYLLPATSICRQPLRFLRDVPSCCNPGTTEKYHAES